MGAEVHGRRRIGHCARERPADRRALDAVNPTGFDAGGVPILLSRRSEVPVLDTAVFAEGESANSGRSSIKLWITLPSMRREDLRLAGLVEQQDLIGLLVAALFHARRTGDHSGDRQARRLRFGREQALHVGRRHVAFDRIAADLAGVAGTELVRELRACGQSGSHPRPRGPRRRIPPSSCARPNSCSSRNRRSWSRPGSRQRRFRRKQATPAGQEE